MEEMEAGKMEDKQIIELYWKRDQLAISETQQKYGRLCRYIACNILQNDEDAKECENDTYAKAWEIIPPKRPAILSAFLSKITRNIAIDTYRRKMAKKRGNGEYESVIDELNICITSKDGVEHVADELTLKNALNQFLEKLPEKNRKIFMRRYWYMSSIRDIAVDFSMKESNVKMTLLRMRNDLKSFLEKEGIDV